MSRMQTPPTSYSHCPAHALSWGAWPLPGGCVSGGPGRLPLPQTVHPSCSHQWSWTPQTGTHASWAWCALKWSGKPMGVHKGRMNSTVVLSSGYGARGAEPNPQLWHHMTMWLYLLEPQFYLLYNGDFNSNNLIGLLWQLTNILSVLGSRLTEIIYLVYLADRYSMKVISYRFCYFLRSSVCLSSNALPASSRLPGQMRWILKFHLYFPMVSISWWYPRLCLLPDLFWKRSSGSGHIRTSTDFGEKNQKGAECGQGDGELGPNIKHMTLQSLELAKKFTPWIFVPGWKNRSWESNTPEFHLGFTTYGHVTLEK